MELGRRQSNFFLDQSDLETIFSLENKKMMCDTNTIRIRRDNVVDYDLVSLWMLHTNVFPTLHSSNWFFFCDVDKFLTILFSMG